ncbi:hypothetical protein L204_102984 [Cryptococcus depauperatus]|nr:hypothetical protein L204_00270 [Cryptococcus depauperatus CBS 7855]
MSIPVPTLSPAESSYIISSLAHPTKPTRPDARQLFASRPISVSYNFFPHANGSASIKVGGTEVLAGIRLEVSDTANSQARGDESWKAKVEVDVTPQAFPGTSSQTISSVSAHLTSLLTSHFIPFLSPLTIIENKKYFQPQLHVTVMSAAGNIASVVFLAARAAFADLRVPNTKVITWTGEMEEGAGEAVDLTGIKASIAAGKTKGKGRSVISGSEDWDLNTEEEIGYHHVESRERLPVLVTLNLVPNSPNVFLDATPQEEVACPCRIHLFFIASLDPLKPNLCGMRVEGPEGLDSNRIRGLLEKGQGVASELLKEMDSNLPDERSLLM